MNVAVVGGGIAGLLCARRLAEDHHVELFEAAETIGGHIATVDVDLHGQSWAVDTGFIVFNTATYPNYVKLLGELGVPWRVGDMSFSARCEAEDVEYNGTSLNAMFAQRRNLLRPRFLRMVRDILRFYSSAHRVLDEPGPGPSLGQYLDDAGFSPEFVDWHLLPMGAAVWSAGEGQMRDFPAKYLIQFFHNHGFLKVEGRPDWLTIRGGSRNVAQALVRGLESKGVRIHLGSPLEGLERTAKGVLLRTPAGPAEFDRAVLACHADQSLALLKDATPLERDVLGAFPYQPNDVVLHTDASLMPRRKRAWAAWNYHVDGSDEQRANVTYWMNRLQGLDCPSPLLVTLNHTAGIDPDKILRRFVYDHPIYTASGVAAQARHAELNGSHRVYFAGAYWGYGFHEDGVNSALQVAEHMSREMVQA